MIIPNEEFIEKNYNKTLEVISSTIKDTERRVAMLQMFETLGERYALAPASSRKEYHSAFPGGLCYHNLNVLQWVGKFSATMAPGEYSTESLLTVALLHDLGKVGDLREDYYLPKNSDWHYKNGIFYEANEKLQYMRIPVRSLYLAQHFGIRLTGEEYVSVLLSEGQYDNANASYKYREPKLAHILHVSDMWSMKIEKTKEVQYP